MSSEPAGQCSAPRLPGELVHAAYARVLRRPGGGIYFSTYDPATATGDQSEATLGFQKLSLNQELHRQKRIVVEYSENELATWRFVPKARWEEGVDGEGDWPRVIEFCGEYVTLTQDEWDLFKLDKEFDCFVRCPPYLTEIRRRLPPSPMPGPSTPSSVPPLNVPRPSPGTPTPTAKRRISGSSMDRRASGSNSLGQRKKARPFLNGCLSTPGNETVREDEADEDEVNEMVVDEDVRSKQYKMSERLRKVRQNTEEARRKRREANKAWCQKRGQSFDDEEDMMSWTECPPPEEEAQSSPAQPESGSSPFAKRKVECFSDDGDDAFVPLRNYKHFSQSGQTKRTRTLSPSVCRRTVELKRMERQSVRKERRDRRKEARSKNIYDKVMQAIYEEAAESFQESGSNSETSSSTQPFFFSQVPPDAPGAHVSAESSQPQSEADEAPASAGVETFPSGSQSQFYQAHPQQSSQETLVDKDEEARRAAIEESKRKIAELEKDRPLWEEQARKRASQEAQEKARAEEARKAHLAQQAAEAERERAKEDASRRKAQETQRAKDAKSAEIREKRRRAKEAADRDARATMTWHWDPSAALKRYLKLSETFDTLRFSDGDVIIFEMVPWPVLMRPGTFAVENIDWTAVETFFRRVRPLLTSPEYQKFVEKSHRRFHPDRWRSRRVLQCVESEEEKECLESAAITVSQALTPIWQDVTGRR